MESLRSTDRPKTRATAADSPYVFAEIFGVTRRPAAEDLRDLLDLKSLSERSPGARPFSDLKTGKKKLLLNKSIYLNVK